MSYVEHVVDWGVNYPVEQAGPESAIGVAVPRAAASMVPGGLCGVAKGFNWCSLPPFHPGPHRALGDGDREIDSWVNAADPTVSLPSRVAS